MLDRRGLFASVGAALCGGAATGSAPAPPRQVSRDVKLFRVPPGDPDGACYVMPRADRSDMEVIDWFDQRPGDKIVAVWTSGRIEGWTVGGEPYMSPRGVEAVKIDEERYYCTVDPKAAFLYWPPTDEVTVFNSRLGRGEVHKGKPTPASRARRPRPTRPPIGRPVIVSK